MARGVRHDEIPSGDDPIWAEWAALVLEQLAKPRSTAQLKQWARAHGFEVGKLVNTIAWMDLRGLIESTRVNNVRVWSRSAVAAAPVLKPVPTQCPKCLGILRAEPERLACVICGHSIYPPVVRG
jgi:hypothetical protein